jgi:predicted TPR repeat methyltransferase
MLPKVLPGFAAVVFCAAFVTFEVSAQTGSDISPDVLLRQAGSVPDSSPAGAPMQPEAKPGNGPVVVSADLLRHPITGKVRRMLLSAMEKMASGDHEMAIEQLRETLAKYPNSAAYVHNLLGVEYVKTDRFKAAVRSFEQAVMLLPHDAMTHYNFGLSLVCTGDFDRAEQEVRRALELDPKNSGMQARLNALLQHNHPSN